MGENHPRTSILSPLNNEYTNEDDLSGSKRAGRYAAKDLFSCSIVVEMRRYIRGYIEKQFIESIIIFARL